MDRSKYNLFRNRNKRDRARADRAEKQKAKEDWNEAVRDEDDDELRRLIAEHGFTIYGTCTIHAAFVEAEKEAINEQDDEEVLFDEQDSEEAGGKKWLRHTNKDFDWDMFPEEQKGKE